MFIFLQIWYIIKNIKIIQVKLTEVRRMLERREMILKILDENGKAKVSDLAKRFQCSEVTICTDIRALEKGGWWTGFAAACKKRPRISKNSAMMPSVWIPM